ncbi:MAG: hypothetical protein ACTSW3_02285 [Promethearchaeota archaeon]
MLEAQNSEIIEFFFKFMCSKSNIIDFINSINIRNFSRNISKKELIDYLKNEGSFIITKKDITEFARKTYLPHLYDIDEQKKVICSGILKNHSWHEAAPSRLHLTFQKWVRAFLKNEITYEDYINKINDVGNQEIYMLIVANITEYLIINASNEIIPNLKERGISDLIINNLAYDVKNTHDPRTCHYDLKKDPLKYQEWLFDSGDLERDLRTAAKAPPHFGYNRIYVIVDPTERWETEFDYICDFIQTKIKNIENGSLKPHIFVRNKNGREIIVHTHLIVP